MLQNINIVLGLVFLKYISEKFNELYEKLEADEYSDPEDRDEHLVRTCSLFLRLLVGHTYTTAPSVNGELLIRLWRPKKKTRLKNVLPKVYGKEKLDKASLGQLIDLLSNTELQAENEKSKDLLESI